jgi:predicted dehydrogenase
MSGQRVNVGIIGGGLMGREIATALARWFALVDHPARPVLTAVCDIDPAALRWFDAVDTVRTRVTDHRDLLADDAVEVVYVAVRHDLHERIYLDTIAAGKDLLAEKPFGIDTAAATRITDAAAAAGVFVRCSSEMPFFPGAQAAVQRITSGQLGPLVDIASGFSHSSDLDPTKPIGWKRQVATCGEAGVLNDLGMHAVHVPLRLGWYPDSVYAVLQQLVRTRPGPDGAPVPCDTHENATLLCTVPGASTGAADDGEGSAVPMTLTTKRIDPGQKNSWSLRVTGMRGGVAFSTRYPKTLRVMGLEGGRAGGEQVWQEVEMGSQGVWPTVTGGIFETGFSDAILQMWAAFLAERAGDPRLTFGCVTPEEALASHHLWDAALTSSRERRAVVPQDPAPAGGRARRA